MERKPVTSSDLKSVGYDTENRVLEIEFTKGAVYQYLKVPETTHRGLMGASSKGSYFHTNIKGRFEFKKV